MNQSGSTIAAIVGAIPALRPIAIEANVFAGSTSFLKVMLDVQEGRSVDTGDLLSIAGSVTGIVGTAMFFAGAAAPAVLFVTGVGIAINLASIIRGDNFTALSNQVRAIAQEAWPTIPVVNMPEVTVTSTGELATYKEIMNNPYLQFGVLQQNWDGTFSWAPAELPPPPPPEGTQGTEGWKKEDCHGPG